MPNFKCHTKLAEYLSKYDFTYFLTLTENYKKDFSVYAKEGQSTARIDLFWSRVATYFWHLTTRVYGTKKNINKKMKHATFFENKDKYGAPTHIHCHSLIIIEPERNERFTKYAGLEWIKLNKTAFPERCASSLESDAFFDLRYINDRHGCCSYVTKHFEHSDFVPIIELQDKK